MSPLRNASLVRNSLTAPPVLIRLSRIPYAAPKRRPNAELRTREHDELRALRRLQREQEPESSFVFTSERAGPFTTAGFARMLDRAGAEAKLGFKPHPHMLRHACGYKLANDGHDTRALQHYLGHKNIQHEHLCCDAVIAGFDPQRTEARTKSCAAQVLTWLPPSAMLRASRMVVT